MMKKMLLASLFIPVICLAQNVSFEKQMDNKLKEIILLENQYSKIKTQRYNSRNNYVNNDINDYFKYTLKEKNVYNVDLNHDYIPDKVVAFTICEVKNCHLTTQSIHMAVFLAKPNNKYEFIGYQSFKYEAEVMITRNNLIRVNEYSYGDNDPACCPEKLTVRHFYVENNRLEEHYNFNLQMSE